MQIESADKAKEEVGVSEDKDVAQEV